VRQRLVAADQPKQGDLEPGAQPARELRKRRARSLGHRTRPRLLFGRQVERQQRPFGQQRRATHRAQVVQQRQQHQRQVPSTAEDALEIGGQLDDRPHQRIETIGLLAGIGALDQEAGRVLHLLGEQCAPVNLRHL